MATRLSGHKWSGPRSKYPWDEWLDGSVWQLTPGQDFASIESFRRVFYSAAASRGGTGRTSMADGHLIIQFTPGEGP